MSINLISDTALQKIDVQHIKSIISKKIDFLRAEFKDVPKQMRSENKKLATKYSNKWKVISQKPKGTRERAQDTLDRLKLKSKELRSMVIQEISEIWYTRLWYLRSEISLISAFYDFGRLETSPLFIKEWKLRKITFSPIALRLNGPRKPTKGKFKAADIKYNPRETILKMLKPLEDWADETLEAILKIKKSGTSVKEAAMKTRYREAIAAREYITVLCQAVAPRQSIIPNGK